MDICWKNRCHFTMAEVSVTSWVEDLSDIRYKSDGELILKQTQGFIRKRNTAVDFKDQELVNKNGISLMEKGLLFLGKGDFECAQAT